jgi:hypothetical protein
MAPGFPVFQYRFCRKRFCGIGPSIGGNILICFVEGMKVIAGHWREEGGKIDDRGRGGGVTRGGSGISVDVEPLKYSCLQVS